MAEETAAAAQEAKPTEQAKTPKLWEDAQVKEIIASRDEAKEARRKAEADLNALKAEAEKRVKEAEKYQADLESERKQRERFDAEQKELREALMAEIQEDDIKAIASSEPLSLKALMTLAKRKPVGPSSDRKPPVPVEEDFDAQLKPKPGEDAFTYTQRVEGLKRAKK